MPFQGHTAFGPAHATADPSNGQMTIYSNDMKSYGMRNGVATFLSMPRDQVRVVWMEGPQGYGRTAADDAGFEAAYLAKEIGRPVRVQWMRHEETAWDTKGPAFACKLRGATRRAGQPGRVRLPRARRRLQPSRLQRARHGADRAADGHAARRAGARQRRRAVGDVRDSEPAAWRPPSCSLPLVWETPLRTGNLRDPERSAGDVRVRVVHRRARGGGEGRSGRVPDAAAHGQRRRTTAASSARDRSPCLKAAADAYGWDPRPSPKSRRRTGNILTGRGIAYSFRSQTVVAQIAEVEVNRRTGPRVGEAARVRARLRAGDQSRRRSADDRVRHAALAEPRAARGGAVRHREGHQRRLDDRIRR